MRVESERGDRTRERTRKGDIHEVMKLASVFTGELLIPRNSRETFLSSFFSPLFCPLFFHSRAFFLTFSFSYSISFLSSFCLIFSWIFLPIKILFLDLFLFFFLFYIFPLSSFLPFSSNLNLNELLFWHGNILSNVQHLCVSVSAVHSWFIFPPFVLN